jgi:hypothetical protein
MVAPHPAHILCPGVRRSGRCSIVLRLKSSFSIVAVVFTLLMAIIALSVICIYLYIFNVYPGIVPGVPE